MNHDREELDAREAVITYLIVVGIIAAFASLGWLAVLWATGGFQ